MSFKTVHNAKLKLWPLLKSKVVVEWPFWEEIELKGIWQCFSQNRLLSFEMCCKVISMSKLAVSSRRNVIVKREKFRNSKLMKWPLSRGLPSDSVPLLSEWVTIWTNILVAVICVFVFFKYQQFSAVRSVPTARASSLLMYAFPFHCTSFSIFKKPSPNKVCEISGAVKRHWHVNRRLD